MTPPQIVWLRRDLRLVDQPALFRAAEEGSVIPAYVLDDETPAQRRLGGASRWWLHHSLSAMAEELDRRGSRLILRRGCAAEELATLARETGAATIHAIRHYEPWWREAEEELAASVDLCLYDGNYLAPPGSITSGSGEPYRIYTPFARALMREMPSPDPLPEPTLRAPESWPASIALCDLCLLPTRPSWADGFAGHWEVGARAAEEKLEEFLGRVTDYDTDRNLPSTDGSSRLSPHLHWGEISPTQVWVALEGHGGPGAESYRRELIWRDFAQNVVTRFPAYPEAGHRAQFARLRWRDPAVDDHAAADLAAWQQGRTGYPIVDAGMRQLWQTGWMHNRVRMLAASFLCKHLLIDWRHGERWFWDTLVDADYANNAVNWQWISGTGVDTQLFTRIMAPLSQSVKFDAAAFIRQWVPELAGLRDEDIHDPPEDRRRISGRALAAYRALAG